MSAVRRAVPEDAEELVRLRQVMQDALSGPPNPDKAWQPAAVQTLRKKLAEPAGDMTAFVVDRPDGAGIAACALGTIEYRLGGPGNPTGTVGYVFNVVTDDDMRRRGLSRVCMEALLGWFQERSVFKIDLKASPEGEPLYVSLGFVHSPNPAMRLSR
ncbi:GNAT family N-acetyltransferase [Streptomyces violascens]|uniref:GNAT family N-acetyltransferase n=1 Tax=Streptomyces violascens TaxID=67381 RepID=UPI003656F3AB